MLARFDFFQIMDSPFSNGGGGCFSNSLKQDFIFRQSESIYFL